MNTFHYLLFGGRDQGCNIVILAMQPHDLVLDRLCHQLLPQGLQIEPLLNTVGHLLFHIQHAALQGAG